MLATRMLDKRSDLPPAVRETIAMIRRNIELEAHFVDDLLDVTRIARGKMELATSPMDIHDAVLRAVEITHGDIEAKGLTLDVKLEAQRHDVNGDAARLQQVFWNLLKNAAKFTPHGGRIFVRSRNESNFVVVEVQDTGIGIEPAVLPQLFEPFTQADVAITRQFGGLGLGLAIAKATVQGHGGEIRASSEGTNRGATFVVSLPLNAAG
jgi:signal transduction histidine kinase